MCVWFKLKTLFPRLIAQDCITVKVNKKVDPVSVLSLSLSVVLGRVEFGRGLCPRCVWSLSLYTRLIERTEQTPSEQQPQCSKCSSPLPFLFPHSLCVSSVSCTGPFS